MTDSQIVVQGVEEPAEAGSLPLIVYVLYLVGLAVPLTGLIGLIMAYVAKGGAPAWVQSHYRWLIRTFWIGLLWAVLAGATLFIFVGYVIGLASLIWYIIRVVKGFVALQKKQPVADPATWLV